MRLQTQFDSPRFRESANRIIAITVGGFVLLNGGILLPSMLKGGPACTGQAVSNESSQFVVLLTACIVLFLGTFWIPRRYLGWVQAAFILAITLIYAIAFHHNSICPATTGF
jgi:hypothetical protein